MRALLITLTALMAGLGCQPPEAPDAATDVGTRSAGLSHDFVAEDGAGIPRAFVFERATLNGQTLRYDARVDGQPRRVIYTQDAGELSIVAGDGDLDHEVELRITDTGVELGIAGELVGYLGLGEEASVVTEVKADEASFALLSLMPHDHPGLRVHEVFGAQTSAPSEGLAQQTQALLGIHLGRIFVRCKKITIRTYACDAQGTSGPDGCSGGSACGTIPCCMSGCRVEESDAFDYGGGASL